MCQLHIRSALRIDLSDDERCACIGKSFGDTPPNADTAARYENYFPAIIQWV
jgi:hypothetical protein